MRTYIYSCGSLVIAAALGLFLAHIPFQPYLFLCGGVLTGLGVWIFSKQITYFRGSRMSYGKLVNWKEIPGVGRASSYTRPEIYYYAVVEFEGADGRIHQVTSATGSSPKPRTPIGKRLPVRYNPDKPDEARLDTLFDYWGPAVLILLMGVVTFVVSFKAVHFR
jgi:hypothetical protein